MPEPTPDPVAAYLDDLGKRNRAFGEGAADVPRLLKALGAVLALHKPAGICLDVRPCERHRASGPKPYAQLRNERRACPDCTFTERPICWQAKCREEEWPCTEYRAISAALLGEVPGA